MIQSSAALQDSPQEDISISIGFTVDRTPFLKALAHVQSVVERRSTIAILSNVKIEAAGSSITLTATDLDMAVSEVIEASVSESGAVTVSAHTLYDIVRKLPENCQVALTTSTSAQGQVVVTADSCQFMLGALPVTEFPVIDSGEVTHEFSIASDQLAHLLGKSSFAMSNEETRYYLNGIYFHAHEEGDAPALRAVATDGHRLACIEEPLPEGAASMPGIIIPRKAVHEIRKLLEEQIQPCSVALSDAKIRLTIGGAQLISKLIDGTFPDYEKVIPQRNEQVMEVSLKRLAQAIDRIATVTSDKTRIVKFSVEPGILTISAVGDDNNSGNETLDVAYSGKAIEAGFNSRFLLELLGCIEGSNTQFCYADSAAPVLIRDTGDTNAIFVVMPLKV